MVMKSLGITALDLHVENNNGFLYKIKAGLSCLVLPYLPSYARHLKHSKYTRSCIKANIVIIMMLSKWGIKTLTQETTNKKVSYRLHIRVKEA